MRSDDQVGDPELSRRRRRSCGVCSAPRQACAPPRAPAPRQHRAPSSPVSSYTGALLSKTDHLEGVTPAQLARARTVRTWPSYRIRAWPPTDPAASRGKAISAPFDELSGVPTWPRRSPGSSTCTCDPVSPSGATSNGYEFVWLVRAGVTLHRWQARTKKGSVTIPPSTQLLGERGGANRTRRAI